MNIKLVVVLFLVFFKDEKKYFEVVDVFDQFEFWVCEIYSKVGLCVLIDLDYVLFGLVVGFFVRLD